jgi:PAS domain S-box-containing protein
MPAPPMSSRPGWRRIHGRTARILLRAASSAALVACLLAASFRIPYVDHATIAVLIIAVVVALAVYRGMVEAVVAALVGGAGFDYFYLPPTGFGIEAPEHWITLAVFLFVAASTGHLASRLKHLLDKRNSLMQLSLEPLCITDLDGNLESVNEAFAGLLGWPEEELKLRPLLKLVHSADRPRTEAAIREAAETGSAIEIENRCQSKEGGWRWLRWRMARGASDASWLSAAARDITGEKWAHEKLRALADQVMNAQEEERRRIARELHDDVTQRLAALGIELGLLKRGGEPPDGAAIHQELTRLQAGVISLSEDIRRLSHSLHPSILEHSTLAAALEMYCREFSQQTGIATSFTGRNIPADVPRPVALAFYRIAQEALRNVALHSGATAASVVLSGENLALNVIDNGRGFDMRKAKMSPGLGLVSMEERARLVGAVVTIVSMPGEGTTVSVALPPDGQVAQ